MTQRYDTYKDSGVQWLGEVPGHWECVPLKYFIETKSGTAINVKELDDKGTYPVYGGGSQIGFCNKYNCEETEIIVGRVGAKCGCVTFPNKKVWATDNALIIKTNLYPRFTAFVLVAADLNRLNAANAQPLITGTKIKHVRIALPPLSEQRSIVSFLDDKCGKIDEWVTKKQKEVEHLQELKQRVIADAVTRGLNPHVKMKATNIPWIKEIPEHWEALRAKHMFNKEQRPVEEGDEIVTCFRDGEVTLRKNRRTTGFTEATDYSHYQHICKGDLVIHQMDAFAGSAGVSDSDGMGTPVLSVCTPKSNNILNEYYAHIVRLMGKNGFILSLYRGIRERSSDFRFDTFANLWLPVPTIEEQKQIVAHITDKTSKIDKLIANINKEIEGIKEYKQRLISDVVTGQIKVN
ncbi:restriction endonuclease subunit S [Prevotella loescheii]|nr:restriction endonuclease subunit S [Hoylesella loescheii]